VVTIPGSNAFCIPSASRLAASTIVTVKWKATAKENGFDELKNQWGLPGFTTQDINRCQTAARACALVYKWWNWYCRTAKPTAQMEAITSHPLLVAAVGRSTHSAGQTTLYLTPMHGKATLLKLLIANIHAALQDVRAAAEQFKSTDQWAVLLRYVSDKIASTIGPFRKPVVLPTTGAASSNNTTLGLAALAATQIEVPARACGDHTGCRVSAT
jgi:hypothetical protein